MKGLELAEKYFYQVGLPELKKEFAQELPRMAFGLAGEGSDCFGYDDEISQDHDWGAGFCIWLTDQDYARFGGRLAEFYRDLPTEGFLVRRVSPQGEGRVGVLKISSFYYRYLGVYCPPEEPARWLSVPEEGLALVTNGRVFQDELGEFSRIRNQFSEGYPQDVYLKKLAAKAAKSARAGQYQLPRCLRRGDDVAALLALTDFLNAAMGLCYLLNGRYMPYFKWRWRGLQDLDLPDGITPEDFSRMAKKEGDPAEQAEKICGCIAAEFRRRGMSASPSDFLQDHALEVFERIQDPVLRRMHFLTE